MTNLSENQFGLFPESHPAMRQLQPHEMNDQQFRTLPGAWHHGTYSGNFPSEKTSHEAAGIHLGTMKSASERLDSMGSRDPDLTPTDSHDEGDPGEIHTRRLLPTANMEGSPKNPNPDLIEDWTGEGGPSGEEYGKGLTRNAEQFGEYYRNDTEDKGRISIRVPQERGYLQSHRGAVDSALREGRKVNPQAAALHRQGKMDLPEKHEVLSSDEHPSLIPFHSAYLAGKTPPLG